GNMAGAILKRLTVAQAVADHRPGDLILVTEQTGFRELLQKYTNSTQVCFPVVDPDQKLTGVIDSGDIRRIVTETGVADLIIARDIERPARTIKSEDSLLSAVNMIAKTDTPALIVVEQEETRTVVGILGRGDIIAAYNRQIAVPAQ
ncbi:MAG: CBS domain-containing protein, partial [Planctomycetota bacterium]|nr:CBS domain-containing protein [Planctomycetota bacterium]